MKHAHTDPVPIMQIHTLAAIFASTLLFLDYYPIHDPTLIRAAEFARNSTNDFNPPIHPRSNSITEPVRHRAPRIVVLVEGAAFGCSSCNAEESAAAGGTGSIKDLALECCPPGGTAGAIVTSNYQLTSGVCELDESGGCSGISDCGLSVTLTIQMGCHQELWVQGRPGADDDDGRIVSGISFPVSLSAACQHGGGSLHASADVKIYRSDCGTSGTMGTMVGRYNPVLRCHQCD